MENKISAIIVEDDHSTSEYLRQRLSKLCPEIKDLEQFFTLKSAFERMVYGQVDIVFLDIQMPDGISFDLLKQLNDAGKADFEIIIITGAGAKDFILKAIKYAAIDYLYKPIDDTELVSAVRKAIEKVNKKNEELNIEVLLHRLANSNQYSGKIGIQVCGGIIEFYEVKDIKYLEADGVITIVRFISGRKLTSAKNLGFYRELLESDYGFISISHSLLVNWSQVVKYNHNELAVVLNDGTTLYASKRYGKDIKEMIRRNQKGTNKFSISRIIKNTFRK